MENFTKLKLWWKTWHCVLSCEAGSSNTVQLLWNTWVLSHTVKSVSFFSELATELFVCSVSYTDGLLWHWCGEGLSEKVNTFCVSVRTTICLYVSVVYSSNLSTFRELLIIQATVTCLYAVFLFRACQELVQHTRSDFWTQPWQEPDNHGEKLFPFLS